MITEKLQFRVLIPTKIFIKKAIFMKQAAVPLPAALPLLSAYSTSFFLLLLFKIKCTYVSPSLKATSNVNIITILALKKHTW